MAIEYKTKEDIEILRKAGSLAHQILQELSQEVGLGVSTEDLNKSAEQKIKDCGATASFLNYRPSGVKRPFPASICISVNDVIVHGIPTENPVVLKEGDLITLDLGLTYKDRIVDTAITVIVGQGSKEAKDLVFHTKEALRVGISAMKVGGHIGDIGEAISKYVEEKTDFYLADDLAGHGVGFRVHEDPYVPNIGKGCEGEEFIAGMVLAIEPMLLIGGSEVTFEDDDYTVRTKSGGLSAHFEHTVAINYEGKVEVLT